MDSAVKHWVALWDYLDGNFWAVWNWAASQLGPEEVSWQPVPAVASIGWNLQHLGEMLDHYLSRVFDQGPLLQPEPLVTMRAGSRDDGRFGDLKPIAAYHRQVRPAYRTFLARLTGADLDKVVTGSRRTYAWAIGHIAEHESYHLGKCTLLRSLLAARQSPGGGAG
jgi:hypothetical protein